MEELS